MRTIQLREFQNKGASLLEGNLDLTLVEGTKSSFFLIPVQKGFEQFQAGLLSRALAKSLLLQSQIHAKATGLADLSMDAITAEVREVRKARAARKGAKK
jgi:hypothetical protein